MTLLRGRARLAGLAAAAALAALVLVWFVGVPHLASNQPDRTPTAERQTSRGADAPVQPPPLVPTPTPTPVAVPRMTPQTLLIPKIGVQATVEQVTNDATGAMAVPQRWSDVGWWSLGSAPGQDGDAVIDGHLDWYGVPQAVFFNLDQLQPGDEVDVVSQGDVTLRFQVSSSAVLSATAQPPPGWESTTGPPVLTLITCAGDWNPSAGEYDERLLVDASFVGDS